MPRPAKSAGLADKVILMRELWRGACEGDTSLGVSGKISLFFVGLGVNLESYGF